MERTRRDFVKRGGFSVVGASVLSGCLMNGDTGSSSDAEPLEIIVGSGTITEQIILGYLTFETLTANTEHALIDETEYGGVHESWEGFLNRDFNVRWSYLGTMWLAHPPQNDDPIEDVSEQYQELKEQMESEYDMQLLEMTPFENSFTFLGRPDWVEQSGITTLSELAEYINTGGYETTTLAVEDAFFDRNDGWQALLDHYGFEPDAVQNWEDNGNLDVIDVGLAYDKLRFEKADVGLGYTTNPQISEYGLKVIEDDRRFWPHYNLVPYVADSVATPEVKAEINSIVDALDSRETMQRLNARVVFDDETPQQVARSFLERRDII